MPKGTAKGGVVLWDIRALDTAMDAIFYPESGNDDPKWKDVAV
jgi:hypothetical protein